MEDLLRIAIVPMCIMIGGFLLEILAVQAKGSQDGIRKFKVWLCRSDNSLHADSPCSIVEVQRHARNRSENLVDITELVSFEDYAGISFDLCIAALTADIIALFSAQKVSAVAPRIASVVALHFLALAIVVMLVTANHRMLPELSNKRVTSDGKSWLGRFLRAYWRSNSKRRTAVAILMGLMMLVTSFVMLWGAL